MKHRSDNQNVVRILSYWSKKPKLHELALQFLKFCIADSIQFHPGWIPRSEDFCADKDDYMLNPQLFAVAGARWPGVPIPSTGSVRLKPGRSLDFVVGGLTPARNI